MNSPPCHTTILPWRKSGRILQKSWQKKSGRSNRRLQLHEEDMLKKNASGLFRFALVAATVLFLWDAHGQAPGVAIYKQGKRESDYDDGIREASHKLFFGTNALKLSQVNEQLKRKSCQLELPPANTNKLSRRDIYVLARGSHLRI